ncbi:MAG: DM13 domain-containing protein [Lysobacterales bacterium]
MDYEVPGNVDLSASRSVVVWCELFGVLFSPAPLDKS